MREGTGVVRAALRYGRTRRAALLVLVIAFAVLGITAYTSYSNVRGLRRTLSALQTGTLIGIPPLPFGIQCSDGGANPPIGQAIGGLPGVTIPAPFGGPGGTCRYVTPEGVETGPPLPADLFGFPGPNEAPAEQQARQEAALDQIRPALIGLARDAIRMEGVSLSPKRIFVSRTRTAGTLWGVLFTVLFVSTLFGAEWRWGVWKTLLTHEPRRGRVLGAKIVAMWLLVAVGYVVVLGAVAGVDAVYRVIWSVGGHGGPGWASLAIDVLHGLPGLEVYATLAAAFAILLRSSMAGLGGPLLLLLLDGLLSQHYLWLRPFVPTQQVAALLPRVPSSSVVSAMWFPEILSKLKCTHGIAGQVECVPILLHRIGAARASAVLAAWIALGCLWAYSMLRARDVPV